MGWEHGSDYLLRYCFYAQFQRPPWNALACECWVCVCEVWVVTGTVTVIGPWLKGVDVYMLHFNCRFWYGFFFCLLPLDSVIVVTVFFFLEKHINKLYDTRRQARARNCREVMHTISIFGHTGGGGLSQGNCRQLLGVGSKACWLASNPIEVKECKV